MTLKEINEKYGIPRRNIFRWMKEHPNLKERDATSLLGHPFPRPVDARKGVPATWDEEEVRSWWNANCRTIGRHPIESPVIIMKYDDYRKATLRAPKVYTLDDGTEEVEDDLLMIEEVDMSKVRTTGDVRLVFRTASDAVLFRLKY